MFDATVHYTCVMFICQLSCLGFEMTHLLSHTWAGSNTARESLCFVISPERQHEHMKVQCGLFTMLCLYT